MTAPLAKRPPDAGFTLVTNAWTSPFWEAAQQQRLVAPRCAGCGHFRMPPSPFCPKCHSQAIDWVTLSGSGRLFSYTVVVRAVLPGMEDFLPYVPAVIELPDADGVRVISNIVDVALDRLRVDADVQVVWDKIGDQITLPRFTLI